MRFKNFALPAALAGLFTASTLLAADSPQAAPGAERRGPGGPGGPGAPGGAPTRGAFPTLTEKQRELLREAAQKDAEQLRGLEEKLRAAQKELVKASLAEKFDEPTVRQKADATAKLQADIIALRAKSFSAIAPTLTPEQREQFENSPFAASMIMGRFGGGAGFGARGDAPGAGPDGGERRRERRQAN